MRLRRWTPFVVIGIFILVIEAKAEVNLVEVEPTYMAPEGPSGQLILVPYRDRRLKWGGTWSIGYSMYEPMSYEPNFLAENFEQVYDSAELPLLEMQLSVKRNTGIGGFSLDLGVGIYANESDTDLLTESNSTLNLILGRVGLTYSLDMLFADGLVRPYISGGAYIIYYREELEEVSFNGNTQVAPYWAAGANFSLDWLDRQSAREAYADAGIQSTALYVEARQFISSENPMDPNFESDVHASAGLRIEF